MESARTAPFVEGTRGVSAARVTTLSLSALIGMRLPSVDQSARDRAGFYLSVVCGGDFSDVAHLNAEFGAERLWKPVGEVLSDCF